MGVPFFSHGWTGVPDRNRGLFQPATGGAPGSLRERFRGLQGAEGEAGPVPVYRDHRAGFAWIFDGSTFWTYDDPFEMWRKARYADSRGLGGVMIWSLDGDTAQGELISALRQGLR